MNKIKVLVVEDDTLVARMYEKSFNTDEFEVISALSGKQGIEMSKSTRPDIILCDIMMPEPDGMEVLKVIKADPETRNIPVVMLTNLSGKHDAELAMQRGATDYWVKKENDPKMLEQKIKDVIKNLSKVPGQPVQQDQQPQPQASPSVDAQPRTEQSSATVELTPDEGSNQS